MLSYIVRRLMFLPVVLFGITVLIFALISTLGPWTRVATFIPSPDAERHVDLEAIIRKYNLDDPPLKMYTRWVNNLLHGNLGWSQSSHMTVMEAIKRRFPATLELTLFAVIPVIIGGILLGVISSVYHNKPIDHTTRIMAITLWSMPDFVLGLAVLMVGYGVLGWFPPGRLSAWAELEVLKESFRSFTGMHTIDSLLNLRFDIFWDALRHIIAPVFTLACLWWAFMLRITRSSMLDVLNQDYVRTARAKGLAENVVIKKHALGNALIPVTTVAGNMLLGLLGGVMIVETVFNYPGLGLLTSTAATRLDVPCVVGVALFYAIILVLVNLVVDLLYSVIDPRVRLE
ncbi:MAG TPA: ABC transporter permease [Firmicutes bacterium]|jgi:ABC-type dipeptide/oligopeptide/nickel transport system permease component|nr:ABC transporter permease [Bacillota bacterium]